MTARELTDALDKFQALNYFWNSFGIPAYETTTVPEGANLGDFYITYEATIDSLDRAIPLSASIWKLNTMSWEEISQKAEEISDALIQVKTIPLQKGFLNQKDLFKHHGGVFGSVERKYNYGNVYSNSAEHI